MSSTSLALAAIWLNILFSFYFKNFYIFQYSKSILKFVVQGLGLQISPCCQNKMVSDNFKRNPPHFSVKKVEHVQLFHIKIKEDY